MTSAHAILMTKKLEMTSVNDEKITYQTKINGTTFTVVLASSENADKSYETLVIQCIERDLDKIQDKDSA